MHAQVAYILFNVIIALGSSLHFTTYAPFLRSIGLELSDISLVNLIFVIAMLVFELPTGLFADRCGRLRAMRIGALFIAIASMLYATATGITVAALSEIIFGVGLAFSSGASQAWLKQQLRLRGLNNENHYKRVVAITMAGMALANLIGGSIGGVISSWSYRAAWVAGGSVFILALLANIAWMREDGIEFKPLPRRLADIARLPSESTGILRRSTSLLKQNAALQWAAGATAAITLTIPLMHYWAAYFEPRLGVDKIGYVWTPMMVTQGLTGLFMHRYGKHLPGVHMVSLGLFIMSLMMLSLGQLPGIALPIGAMAIYDLGVGLFRPSLDSHLQEHIPDERLRATYGSLNQSISHVSGAISLSLCWLLTRGRPSNDPQTIVLSLIVFGLPLGLVSLLLWLNRPARSL